MILPKNGRIVVIDDDPADAIPLIRSLSSKGFPVVYFQGNDPHELPERPFDDVRVIFLDIDLGFGSSERNQVLSHIGLLDRLINLNQKTKYLIVFWAKDDHLIPDIMTELEQKPCSIKHVRLAKSNFRDIGYPLDHILRDLDEKLPANDPFSFFIYWENLVHQSTNDIISDFASLYDDKPQWNAKMLSIFHKLAEAYAGKHLRSDLSDDISKNAMMAFNGTFKDSLEANICSSIFQGLVYEGIAATTDLKAIASINTKLLLTKNITGPQPGNIYFQVEDQLTNKLCYAVMDRCAVLQDFMTANNITENICIDGKVSPVHKRNFDEHFSALRNCLKSKSQLIVCEVSPSCDHAQKKWEVCRLLFGLLIPAESRGLLTKGGYFITTPPIVLIDDIPSVMIFDPKQLRTVAIKELSSMPPKSRMRKDLIFDIQHKLAHHASRPGIISV